MSSKIIIVGQPPEQLISVAKEKGIDLIVVEDQEVLQLAKPQPMIIMAPKIVEMHFEDYKTGQEKRRERRAKAREKLK